VIRRRFGGDDHPPGRPDKRAAMSDSRPPAVPDAAAGEQRRLIVLGQINGLHGVRGWVKIYSHTAPREGILGYPEWQLGRRGEWRSIELLEGRQQGKNIIARLAGIDSREAAEAWLGAQIAVPREALPEDRQGGVYWADLIGLRVVNRSGVELGRIDHLFATGANDVMVVRGERERLIPWISSATGAAMRDAEYLPAEVEPVILDVDLAAAVVTVDWDADF